jgi:hypothetical protein
MRWFDFIPLPDQFFDVAEVAKLPSGRRCSACAALLIYVVSLTSFGLFWGYYTNQTISSEVVVVSPTNSDMPDYDCTMMIPLREYEEGEFPRSSTCTFIQATSNCYDPPCALETSYTGVYFRHTHECTILEDPRVWNYTFSDFPSGGVTFRQIDISANLSVAMTGGQTGRVTLATLITDNVCDTEVYFTEVLDHYIGKSTSDVSRICAAVEQNRNPPYSCTRTSEVNMYDSLDTLALSFGNTQLMFAFLASMFTAVSFATKRSASSNTSMIRVGHCNNSLS